MHLNVPGAINTTAKVLPPECSAELEKLSDQPKEQLSAMRAFVSRPDTGSWTADAIQRILKDPTHLAEIAQQSFPHPLGFDSIPLEISLPSHRVRLHLWWPETDLVIEDVHNHAWSFASRILSGDLNFKTYRTSDVGMPFCHYRYRYGDKGDYRGDDITTVTLAMTFDGSLTQGTYYSFDLRALHRVAPIKTDQPVGTLVLTGAIQRDGSDVYTEKARHGQGYRLLTTPYTAGQLADRLRRFIEFL